MTTHIYIAVNGTCTAGPDDNLFSILEEIANGKRQREFSQKLNREVTGGGTVLWVKSPQEVYMIDTGDEADRSILENSLSLIKKEENIDPIKAVKSIYHSHAHPDHNGNNDIFKHSYWMVPNDDKLVEIVLGKEETEGINAYNNFRNFYESHRRRGITSDKFSYYIADEHPGKPYGLTILDTPGHEKSHKGFIINDNGVIITNLETGEETKTNRILFTGDCLCDERYLERLLDTNPLKKLTAIYGSAIPTEQYIINDPKKRIRMNLTNMLSMKRLLKEAKKGGYFIFGHSGVFDITKSRV